MFQLSVESSYDVCPLIQSHVRYCAIHSVVGVMASVWGSFICKLEGVVYGPYIGVVFHLDYAPCPGHDRTRA